MNVMNVPQVTKRAIDSLMIAAAEAHRHRTDWISQGGTEDDGDAFIAHLVQQNVITDFQGKALADGISGPAKLGPYRVYDRVVAGRLGTLYRAVHEEFNQPVTLKIFPARLKDDPEKAARLAREARVSVQVDHPHVVRTYHIGRVGDVIFLAIEDLRGMTLADLLEQEQVLPYLNACRLIRQVALGLDHLHSLDIVHRDIQPGNIWVTDDGRAKLMEFGAARDALANLEHGGDDPAAQLTWLGNELLGSYDYISSEQAADEHSADARSDIYSLGCVLYRCLTGEVVFPDKNPVRKMARHANEPAPFVSEMNPDVPPDVSDVVATMLAKNPDDRYQSGEDLAWALEQVIGAEEKHLAVADEVSPDFLAWADSSSELVQPDEVPIVVAEPEFVDFVNWLAEVDAEEERRQGRG
jgi:serine/threonine-protein kinase